MSQKSLHFILQTNVFCNQETSQIFWLYSDANFEQQCKYVLSFAERLQNLSLLIEIQTRCWTYHRRRTLQRGVCVCTSAYQGRPDCSSARTGPLTKAQLHRIVTQSNLTEGHRKVCEDPPLVTLPSCCQLHWWGLCWGKFLGMPLRSQGIRWCLGGLFILLILYREKRKNIIVLTGMKNQHYIFILYGSTSSH